MGEPILKFEIVIPDFRLLKIVSSKQLFYSWGCVMSVREDILIWSSQSRCSGFEAPPP